MKTFLKLDRDKDTQKTAAFSGEGAYHGSTRSKIQNGPLPSEAEEATPYTLIRYVESKQSAFENFTGEFTNLYQVKKILSVPTQDEIKNDQVTFCWAPFEQALLEAGPLTRRVLQEMEPFLEKTKKYIYVDSKIQYFDPQDLPVDSNLWHVDGTIAIKDHRAQALGYTLLHDMKTRVQRMVPVPKYLAYQSSIHCATQFVTEPLSLTLPDCIPNFELLDQLVRQTDSVIQAQPAASIVSFDGLSLHRAVPAQTSGWRLWIRVVETDREIKLNSSIIECYNTVFKPAG